MEKNARIRLKWIIRNKTNKTYEKKYFAKETGYSGLFFALPTKEIKKVLDG